MKKFLSLFLTGIFVLTLLNTTVFATQPAQTPSPTPPMDFTVTTQNGDQVVFDKTNQNFTVTFTVSGKNGGFSENFTIDKIVNKSSGYSYTINKVISVGDDTWKYVADVSFSPTDVGTSVEFWLYWTDFAGNSNRIQKAAVKVLAPVPQLSIEAVVDSTSAAPGTLMQVKYVIKNTGNVPVKNILIKDKAVSDINGLDTFTTDDYLSVNGTIIKFVSFLLDGELTLAPAVTFTYDGKGYENAGEQVKLISEEVMPEVSLTCDSYVVAQKGSKHTFNYYITNTSPVKITNIRVYDSDSSNANLVEEIESLDISQSASGSFSVPIEKSGFYKFKIVYTYNGADGDKTLSAKTDKSLKLPNEVYLQVSKVEPDAITEPGQVTFTLLIENSTNYELRDLVITEETGLFDKVTLSNIIIPAMKNGQPGQYTYTIDVNIPKDETTVLFNLGYSINDEHSTINTSYDINFIKATSEPTDTNTPVPVNDDDNNAILWIVLIIIFLLIILALIIVLIILKNRNSKKPVSTSRRKMNSGFDDEDGDYELDDDFYIDENEIEELDVDSLNEEFANELDNGLDDELDDDGVKIYKRK